MTRLLPAAAMLAACFLTMTAIAAPAGTSPAGTPQTVPLPPGTVVVAADMKEDGSASNCHVVASSDPRYNDAALKYCVMAHVSPHVVQGMPVPERGHRFTLHFSPT